MTAGDTFLVPDSDDHLWVVISDPNVDPSRVVIVCFLSHQPHYDQACVLEPGDHPFIKHPTCVNYPDARIESAALLERLKGDGRLKPKTPLSSGILDRIRSAAEDSEIPTEGYDILRRQGYVP